MSDPSTPPADDRRDSAVVTRSTTFVIAALVLAECVSAFEAGMIFIALPRFGEIFDAPASTTGWAVTAYMLVAATTALVGGRLGDMYGRKKVLIIAMMVSTLGSVISVFGDSMGAIILAEVCRAPPARSCRSATDLHEKHSRRARWPSLWDTSAARPCWPDRVAISSREYCSMWPTGT